MLAFTRHLLWCGEQIVRRATAKDLTFLLVTYYSGVFILEIHKVVCGGGADVRVLFVFLTVF